MKSLPPLSLSRTASRLALWGLALVGLLPPLLWAGVGGFVDSNQARAGARAAAWMLSAAPTHAVPDQTQLLAALGLPVQSAQVVLEGAADQVTSAETALAAPTFSVSVPLARPAGTVRAVSVERSLRPLLLQTLWVALASAACAIALWALRVHRTVGLMARAESHMRSLASLDALTGLLNREGLRRRLQRALARRADSGISVGVLLVDLDRFGVVNETLGQAAGDDLLRSVADRVRAVTRSGDGLARLSGDQFAVHVDSSSGEQALASMARNLHRSLAAPHTLEGREVVATVSIGVALAQPDNDSVDDLLHRAAQALRAAKKLGGNRFCAYEPDGDADDSRKRMDLEQRLHGALGAGQFFVVYQPIVDAASEHMHTVEALLRWRDPQRGTVSPVEFIPALEQTGLIVAVGRWVLREACLQAVRWPGPARGKPLGVSVNLSPRQFAEGDFLQMVGSVLRETGLAPERLQLEVTEGLLLDPTPQTLRKLAGLAELGIKLAVDDFGMGYSSLMYLKRFQLHALKIDRMFVRDIAERAQDLTIVRAIIDLGHGLGMRVTAEGVETRAQSDALAKLGCDALQGYLFGRPADAKDLVSAAAAAADVAPGAQRVAVPA